MKKKLILLTSILILIILIIPFVITICTHNYYFSGRTDYQSTYYNYLSNENPNFTREESKFNSYDNELTGYFYSQKDIEEYDALLIWVHGMNVSHENYLSEINYLTKQNYLIFAYDNTGVNYSEGDGLKGLLQSPLDLQNALNHIYDLEIYNDMKNILVGHSWGGFSVSCVSQLDLKREVDGIISLAGFCENVNVLIDTAQYYVGKTALLLTPYLNFYENLLFFDSPKLNGVDGFKASNCPVLIIHSKDDVIVHYDTNYQVYKNEFAGYQRFTFKEYDDFGHNITINKDAYERIHDIMHHEYTKELDLERNQLLEQLNYVVLNDITTFLNEIK